ncbi:MAG: NADH-quinone oxidoreductase subunit NuoF [Sedimentisphaerales bacterium]|nr:NADH-quinone oxidoreductase subunit NuoF [Sedimentisphaerales bacterium]
MEFEPVLTRNLGVPNIGDLKVYQSRGGYEALRQALASPRNELKQTVKDSGLRGRGGAGFFAGVKWDFLPADHPGPFYLVVNFDESEPGTFKDRYLCDIDPHQILEGVIVTAYINRIDTAYIFIRGEFHHQAEVLQRTIKQAYKEGLLGKNILSSDYSLECVLHRGAGAYICGEETGMLEALEGKRGWPRLKPPYPAVAGAFGQPTVINNVETLCCVPPIIQRGADWFKSMGTKKSTGPKLYGISGHVNRPGVVELPLGVPCRELIEKHAGGVRDSKRCKGVIPGGVSMGVLTRDELDCPLDFEGPPRYGCMGLGTAGVIVMDEDTCMVTALRNIVRFFAHESCGQCTGCREGSGWMLQILNRLLGGQGRGRDLELLLDLADAQGMAPGKTICGLSDGTAWAARTFINKYRSEFEAKVSTRDRVAV